MQMPTSLTRCRYGRTLVVGLLKRPVVLHNASSSICQGREAHAATHHPHHDAHLNEIRNIGIIAHVDAGKTTTTERMLYHSGITRHLGNVDHGDTITDFLPMERERGITIQSAAISFNWPLREKCPAGTEPMTINLIDTPGHQDFRFEVDRCLPILDGAVCIIDSVKGVEAHTERVWASAQQFKIPRVVFVNKLDREGASFKKSVLDIASRLNAWPVACQIPWWEKDKFVGVIDIIQRIGYRWKTESTASVYHYDTLKTILQSENLDLLDEIEKAREKLVEKLCEEDDELTEVFSDQGSDIVPQAIQKALRRAISDGEGKIVPVFAGASLRNMGVEPLLDAVVDYLPSPQERPDLQVHVGSTTRYLKDLLQNDATSKQKPGKVSHQPPVAAIASVFKVVNDPRRGMLSFVRVYHGTLNKSSSMWNASMRVSEKPLNMLQISASKTQDIPHLTTGSIGALTGLKSARTGDTLITFLGHKTPDTVLKGIQIRPANVPPAVAFIAIEPLSVTAQQALEKALESASREDPSLRWSKDENSDQFILSGMGRLHLEVAINHLKNNYNISNAMFGNIDVDYKECLKASTGSHRYEFDRAIAGKTGKAACTASLEPLDEYHGDRDTESSIEADGNIVHVEIPLPADGSPVPFDVDIVRQGLQNGAISALYRGPRRGSPLNGCHVTIVFDPSTDFFGPTPNAHYVNAAYHAVREALKSAHMNDTVGILEPVMKVRIQCPEEVAGVVQHDLASGRGGHVLEINDLNNSPMNEGLIDTSQVYAPPDPYESISSLRDSKKGITRWLELVAKVPLKEMLEYDQHLRSKTAGRHSLTMELYVFERVTGAREKDL